MTERLPFVISIDPKMAIDLDDAIGVRVEGKYLIADVCLPDVPAFVPLGSGLDQQACERGMTIYRSTQIKQPMLSPEVNSHLTLSSTSTQMMVWVQLRYSHQMELVDVTLERVRHRTAARMSYQEADLVLTTPEHPLHKHITDLSIFARALYSRRQKRTGALFDIASGLYTGEDGGVHVLAEQDRYQSHLIVMEFMIATNAALAELAHRTGAAILYRNHKPDAVSSGERNAIKAELEQIHGMAPDEAQAHIRHIACRVGAATLGTESQGHWGLDTPHYAWFTSPLRRYPDIVNLRALLEGVVDPDLAAKAEQLTELYQASGKDQRNHMKFKAYRQIFQNLKRGGPAAIEDIALRTAINALDHAGYADDRLTAHLVRHRIASGNCSIPHLLDLLLHQVGVTREDALGPAAHTALEPANVGLALRLLAQQDLIKEAPVLENGRAAAATILKNLLESRHRPVPPGLVKKAAAETIKRIATSDDEIQAALQALYEDDAPFNSKSKLLEIAAKQQASVEFKVVGRSGPDHEPTFEVAAKWTRKKNKIEKRASGRSIALAERYVSRDMLLELSDTEETSDISIDTEKHPKSSLLEHAAVHRGKLSVGKSKISGPDHQPQFEMEVQYSCKSGKFVAIGTASSKKEAERRACQLIVNDIVAQSTASGESARSFTASHRTTEAPQVFAQG